jgi:hypothetical protein
MDCCQDSDCPAGSQGQAPSCSLGHCLNQATACDQAGIACDPETPQNLCCTGNGGPFCCQCLTDQDCLPYQGNSTCFCSANVCFESGGAQCGQDGGSP